MKTSKDALAVATTSVLEPVLSLHSFSNLGARKFARINDGVMQYLDIQLSSGGNKQFAVNYSSFTLYCPRNHVVLDLGGRFPRIKGHSDGWWTAKDQDSANISMCEVTDIFENFALPWFTLTFTTKNLLAKLSERSAKLAHSNAHWLFDICCCQARLGNLKDSLYSAKKSKEIYEAWYQAMPIKIWCLEGVKMCEQIIAAIDNDTQDHLLNEWYRHSIQHLKLDKLLKSKADKTEHSKAGGPA